MQFALYCTFILALTSFSWADNKLSEEEAIEKVCIAEVKANEKEVHDFWEPTVNYDKTTPSVKCQLKCVMEKMGHLKGGIFNADKAHKEWNEIAVQEGQPTLSLKAFMACKQEKGANDCETVFKINKCLRLFKA